MSPRWGFFSVLLRCYHNIAPLGLFLFSAHSRHCEEPDRRGAVGFCENPLAEDTELSIAGFCGMSTESSPSDSDRRRVIATVPLGLFLFSAHSRHCDESGGLVAVGYG